MDDRGHERPVGPVLAALAVVAAALLVAVAGGRGDLGTASDQTGELVVERSSEPLDPVVGPSSPRVREGARRDELLRVTSPALIDPSSPDRLVVARSDGSLQSVDVSTGSVTSLTLDGADAARQIAVVDDLLVLRTSGGLLHTDVHVLRAPAPVEGFRGDAPIDLISDGDGLTAVSASPGGWSLGRITARSLGIQARRGVAVVPNRPVDVGPDGVLTEVPGNALVTGPDDDAAAAVPGVPLGFAGERVVTLLCEVECEVRATHPSSGDQVAVALPPHRLVERRTGHRAVVDGTGRRLALTLLGGPDGAAQRQPAVVDLDDGTLDLVPVALPAGTADGSPAWSSDGSRLFVAFADQVVVWSAADGNATIVDLGGDARITDLAVG